MGVRGMSAVQVLDGLARLPETLEYTGEFGAELVLFLPFCNWLSKAGLLHERRIKTYAGMRCFYDGLDCAEILEKTDSRGGVAPAMRMDWLPVRNEHSFDRLGRSPFHFYPDLRGKFRLLPLPAAVERASKPLLIVHNKFTREWRSQPVNFLSLELLEGLFSSLKGTCTIVYIRHGMAGQHLPGFTGDHQPSLAFADRDLLARHPEILCFDDLFAACASAGFGYDVNTFKNALYSRCYRFISSQGGGAHHIAMFSGSLLAILHRKGRDIRLAYNDGYYSFMSNPAPIRLVAENDDELLRSVPVFASAREAAGRTIPDPAQADAMESLSPWRFRAAHVG